MEEKLFTQNAEIGRFFTFLPIAMSDMFNNNVTNELSWSVLLLHWVLKHYIAWHIQEYFSGMIPSQIKLKKGDIPEKFLKFLW